MDYRTALYTIYAAAAILIIGIYAVCKYWERRRGCLYGKTQQQKEDFFRSLTNFSYTDEQFFKEQCMDLQYHELKQFEEYLKKQNDIKRNLLRDINKLSDVANAGGIRKIRTNS